MDRALDPDQLWGIAKAELQQQMVKATFDTWLRGSWVKDVSEDRSEWVIGVFNTYAQDWLTHRLGVVVARTLSRVVGQPVAMRFEVGRPPDRTVRPVQNIAADLAAAEQEPIIEAVREQRVTMGAPGGALQWVDFYIKLKVSFRKRALKQLKGARLSVFLCLALHVDRDGVAMPGGIEAIMHETGYSRGAVCSALAELERAGLIQKRPNYHGPDEYVILGYAWFGQTPAPSLWEGQRLE